MAGVWKTHATYVHRCSLSVTSVAQVGHHLGVSVCARAVGMLIAPGALVGPAAVTCKA